MGGHHTHQSIALIQNVIITSTEFVIIYINLILSIVAFVFALAVLGLQLATTSKWVSQADPVNHPSGWNALIE